MAKDKSTGADAPVQNKAPEGASEAPDTQESGATTADAVTVSTDAQSELTPTDVILKAIGPRLKSEWVYILEAVKHDGKLLAVGDEVEMSTADALALVNCGAAALVESPKDS